MKRVRAAIAAVATVFSLGCAAPHLITLQDGTTYESKAEPKFNKRSGFYEFKSRTGERVQLNKDEIRSIKRLAR